MRAAGISLAMRKSTPRSPFISPSQLVSSSAIPIDGTWLMPSNPINPFLAYQSCRIPNARFFNLDATSDSRSKFPHMLPPAEKFSREMGKLGIKKDDEICVYDLPGLFSAARVYWTFKVFGHTGPVSILEGGLKAYQESGYPIDTDPPAPGFPDPVDYGVAELDSEMVVDFEEVVGIVKGEQGNGVQVLDARPGGRFSGVDAEPRPSLSSGHMPSSISLPFSTLLTQDGKALISEDALRRAFENCGVDLERPVVVSCGSGVTACVLGVALETIGVRARVYDESWTGYADPSRAGNMEGMIVKDPVKRD